MACNVVRSRIRRIVVLRQPTNSHPIKTKGLMQAAGTIRTTEQRQSQANKASKRLCLLKPPSNLSVGKCSVRSVSLDSTLAGSISRDRLAALWTMNFLSPSNSMSSRGLLVPRAHGLNLRTWRVTRITCCATCATLLGSLRWSSNVGKKRFLMRLPNSFFVVLWDIWRYVLFFVQHN